MLEYLRERRYQQGQRDRDAGSLPTRQNVDYLEGYLKGRPEGLDGIMGYFPSVEDYINYRQWLRKRLTE
jgi:hypothetical protein